MKFLWGIIVGIVVVLGIILHVPWYWFVIVGLVSFIGLMAYLFKDMGSIW